MNSTNDIQDINKGFYRAFEERFRGTRRAIKSRLMVYLPFLNPLKKLYETCNAVDLGCGRGEWLELLKENNIVAHGVDLDDGMLAACRELGLSVDTGDAISFLKSLPDESQAIISGFHIIEHIEFADLQILIQEAFRALQPAGLLILETPNPENLVVSSTNFHLDPSHLQPIPPQLLSFLTEYYGFCRTKILRLQEPFNVMENKLPNLFNVLYGVSPDYSVVAQKKAADEQLSGFSSAFDKEYGLSLETLAAHYDVQVARVLDDTRAELSRLNDIQVDRDRIQAELNSIYQSRSWKITAPLRKTLDIGRGLLQKIRRLFPLHTLPKRVAFKIMRSVSIRVIIPLTENRIANAVANRFPGIKRRLKRWVYGVPQTLPNLPTAGQSIPMSPPVMRIYLDLLNNIKKHNQQD